MSLKSEQGSIGREDSERGGTYTGTRARFMTRGTDKHKVASSLQDKIWEIKSGRGLGTRLRARYMDYS